MPDTNQHSSYTSQQPDPAVPAKTVLDSSELLKFESLLEDLRGQETPPQPSPHERSAKTTTQQTGAVNPQKNDQDTAEGSDIVTRKIAQSLHGLEELESELGLLDNHVEKIPHNPLLTERLAESILECSRDAIAVLDGNKVLHCNSMAEVLFGFDREQHIGLNLVRVIRENFQVPRKLLKETIRRLENGNFIEQEVRSVGNDRSVWYELKLKRFQLANQERTIMMARDISQRKRYEIELAQSRDFLNKTINAVPEPLSVKDSDLNVVLVNDAFCETHNVLRDQVIGKTAEMAMPQSYSPETSTREQQVFETGERHAGFEAFVDVNNEQFILSTYRSTFQDQTNDQSYVVAVSRDVTAEMKRENRLQLLASVFKNAQEGVAILNPDGTICEANPEFIATVGKAHAKILGTTLEDVLDLSLIHI